MKEFTICWTGTVTGYTTVEAETLEEAFQKAEDSDENIDIEIYPDDWEIEKDVSEMLSSGR